MKLTKTTTIELTDRPQRVDHRSGLQKLKDIIFDLREFYKDGDRIPYDDVEDAIFRNCGIDDRTVKKYLNRLVKLSYFKPVGRPIKKRTRVNVTTFSRIDASPEHNPKEYTSSKGHSFYVFGLFAPKRFTQDSLPPTTPLPSDNESSVNMENMCVSDSRDSLSRGNIAYRNRAVGGKGGRPETLERKERRDTVSHTHNFFIHSPNQSQYTSKSLNMEEKRILKVASMERT